MPSCADLLLVLALLFPGGHISGEFETLPLQDRDGLLDVEINSAGTLYLLYSGLPRLVVLPISGPPRDHDLSTAPLPGGLCLDGTWGWYVSSSATGMIYRYGPSGETVDSLTAPGGPGDLCLAGLSVVYIARETGAISQAGSDGVILARLDGPGEGQLTASGSRVIYSDGTESMMLDLSQTPRSLDLDGTWAFRGDRVLLLDGDSLFSADGSAAVEGAGRFDRFSCSPGGACLVFWSPGGGEVLVSR